MVYLFLLAGFVASALFAVLIIPNILLISYKRRLFDIPDSRKVHKVPVPRLGGLSFLPVILISFCLVTAFYYYYIGTPLNGFSAEKVLCDFLSLMVGSMLLYLVGVRDDLIGVGYRYKFIVQIFAAILLIWPGGWLNSLGGLLGIHALPALVGMPLTILAVVYITNAINLIDGIDGLASGLSYIALVVLGILYAIKGEYLYALLAFSTLGVLVPFWFYNVFGNAQRGHKLFMGDAGSLTLGYILSMLAIHLSIKDPADTDLRNPQMVVAFSTLIVPMFDVVRVVLHRLRNKKNPFLPDKNHFHHKLLRTGMRVRMVMVTILCVSLFFIGLNWLLASRMDFTGILILDVVLWTAMQLGINYFIRKKESDLPHV